MGAFVNENLKTEKEKEFLARVLVEKKLAYGDTNLLLKNILKAIIISDGNHYLLTYLLKQSLPFFRAFSGVRSNLDALRSSMDILIAGLGVLIS